MTEITEKEADALIATEVMGWTEPVKEEYITPTWRYEDENGAPIYGWHPTRDLNQCFQALEALNRLYIITSIRKEGFTVSIWDHFEEKVAITNHNPNHAIICALLEAVTGKTYTIKED